MCVNIFIQLYAQNLCSWEKAKKVTLKCLGWFAECLSLVKLTGRIIWDSSVLRITWLQWIQKVFLNYYKSTGKFQKAESLTIVRILVFCLQTSKNLSRVIIWWTRCYKFLKHCKKGNNYNKNDKKQLLNCNTVLNVYTYLKLF